ncbi:MAG: Ig domain-containing protein [Gaiellaceae bacterium]
MTITPARIVRLTALTLLSILALTLAPGAAAEKPRNNQRPYISEGEAKVGSTLKAGNGSWFCNPAEACATTNYQYIRCLPNTLSGCVIAQPEGASNSYVVQAADVGYSLAVDVYVRGTDCGEWNYSTGTRECRDDYGVATSVPTAPVVGNGTTAAPATPAAPAAPVLPTLGPDTLPEGVASAPYPAQTLTTSNGTGPFSYAVTAGSLPPGLALSPGGIIDGTPTQGGRFSFTVKSTGSGGSTGTRSYTLGVRLMMSPLSFPDAVAGAPYSQSFTITAGGTPPYSFAVTEGALPAGMTLSSAGILGGTPTEAGSSTFTVVSTDARGARGIFSYTVTVALPSLRVGPTDLRPATSGAAYSQALSVTGGTAPYAFSLSSGALPRGIELETDGVLKGTPTVGSGTFTFTVGVLDANGAPGSGAFTLTVSPARLVLRPTALGPAVAGRPYRARINASGGQAPYRYVRAGGTLPAGVVFSSDGLLKGTPKSAGTFSFSVRATDANGVVKTQAFRLVVRPRPA